MIEIEKYVGKYLREWGYTKRYAPRDEVLRQQGLEWAFYPGNKQGVLCDPRLNTTEEWRGPIVQYELNGGWISYYEGDIPGLSSIGMVNAVDIGYIIDYIEWHVKNHYSYEAAKNKTALVGEKEMLEASDKCLEKYRHQKELIDRIKKCNPYLQEVLYDEDGCMKSDTVTIPSEMAQEMMYLLQEYMDEIYEGAR